MFDDLQLETALNGDLAPETAGRSGVPVSAYHSVWIGGSPASRDSLLQTAMHVLQCLATFGSCLEPHLQLILGTVMEVAAPSGPSGSLFLQSTTGVSLSGSITDPEPHQQGRTSLTSASGHASGHQLVSSSCVTSVAGVTLVVSSGGESSGKKGDRHHSSHHGHHHHGSGKDGGFAGGAGGLRKRGLLAGHSHSSLAGMLRDRAQVPMGIRQEAVRLVGVLCLVFASGSSNSAGALERMAARITFPFLRILTQCHVPGVGLGGHGGHAGGIGGHSSSGIIGSSESGAGGAPGGGMDGPDNRHPHHHLLYSLRRQTMESLCFLVWALRGNFLVWAPLMAPALECNMDMPAFQTYKLLLNKLLRGQPLTRNAHELSRVLSVRTMSSPAVAGKGLCICLQTPAQHLAFLRRQQLNKLHQRQLLLQSAAQGLRSSSNMFSGSGGMGAVMDRLMADGGDLYQGDLVSEIMLSGLDWRSRDGLCTVHAYDHDYFQTSPVKEPPSKYQQQAMQQAAAQHHGQSVSEIPGSGWVATPALPRSMIPNVGSSGGIDPHGSATEASKASSLGGEGGGAEGNDTAAGSLNTLPADYAGELLVVGIHTSTSEQGSWAEEDDLAGVLANMAQGGHHTGMLMDSPVEDSLSSGDERLIWTQQRLVTVQSNLIRAWDARQRSTPEDWSDWMKGLSLQLLRESPSPALRACWPLAQNHPLLGRRLLRAAFLSCWPELYDATQDDLVKNLEMAFKATHIPLPLLRLLLELAQFMEQLGHPLPIDQGDLGLIAEQVQAHAKALFYKEAEFHSSPSTPVIEALLGLNNRLQLPEAANGILRYARTHHGLDLTEGWYERLQRWDDALDAYERKQLEQPENPDWTIGRMRCLRALGEWPRVGVLADEL